MKRVRIIGSSGGSALAAALKILQAHHPLPLEISVLTDRECGLESVARAHGLEHHRIHEPVNSAFSSAAADWIRKDGGAELCLLFFHRLVTPELFRELPVYNIHPALLPAFPGLNAIRQTVRRRVRFLGATLHLVNARADEGPIVAQVVMPISPGETEARLNKFSFIQKTYLTLVLLELVAMDALSCAAPFECPLLPSHLPMTDRANPALQSSALLEGIRELQGAEGVAAF